MNQLIETLTNEPEYLLGAMGIVFLARELTPGGPTGRQVALKVMHPHLASEAQVRGRFAREAAILRKLEGPHVCRILASGECKNPGGGEDLLCLALPRNTLCQFAFAGISKPVTGDSHAHRTHLIRIAFTLERRRSRPRQRTRLRAGYARLWRRDLLQLFQPRSVPDGPHRAGRRVHSQSPRRDERGPPPQAAPIRRRDGSAGQSSRH